MTIPDERAKALVLAHELVDLGIPVFAGRLRPDGNPDSGGDHRWKGWDQSPTGRRAHAVIDRWRPGEALCMVTGVKMDVIDVDPRNGGTESFERFIRDLGDDGPEVYLSVATPSGGRHYFIDPLGIGNKTNFLPGLDLKGGMADGTRRGFVFIPPTARRSKTQGRGARPWLYQASRELEKPNGHGNTGLTRKLIDQYLAERGQNGTAGRQEADELRAAVLAAGPGDQRGALLLWVHELERRGYAREDIISLCVGLNITNYDRKRPWDEKSFRSLLHKPGAVIPDADQDEQRELAALARSDVLGGRVITPSRGLVRRMSDVAPVSMSWLWEGYLPIGELVILDGEKGVGKTFVLVDITARGSRGWPMPGATRGIVPPFSIIYFSYEGASAFQPRLVAAQADLHNVFMPLGQGDRPARRGAANELDPLALPGGAANIAAMVREAGIQAGAPARLAIFDPITDFLDRDTNSHNDAQVRAALRPLGEELRKLGCCGIALRHMNKDTSQKISFRGTGSTAFQNRSRIHLVAVELPEPADDGDRQFVVGMADANDVRRVEGSLAYRIVDSDVHLDEQSDRMVGRVDWDGYRDIDVRDLGKPAKSKGPDAYATESLVEHLTQMFDSQDEWPATEAIEHLKAAGLSVNQKPLDKAKRQLDIRSRQVAGGWVWERRIVIGGKR